MKVLLLEEEEYTRTCLKQILLESGFIDEVFETACAKEAVKVAAGHNPEIAMLDIHLEGGVSGLEVARKIDDLSLGTSFVFVTGFGEHALDSFAVHPFDYILKPFHRERVEKTLRKLAARKTAEKNRTSAERLVLKTGRVTLFIPPQEISFVEKKGEIAIIHCDHDTYQVKEKLVRLDEILGENFLRVHKSFIVNMSKISKVTEVGNRSFEISFFNSCKKAYMSRYGFEKYRLYFTPRT